MWRSIVSRSRNVSRSLSGIRTSKAPSSVSVAESDPQSIQRSSSLVAFARNISFFSMNAAEENPISPGPEIALVESDVSPGRDVHGELDASDLGFAESDGADGLIAEATVDADGDGDGDVGGGNVDDWIDEVYEVDVEKLESVLSLLRSDEQSLEFCLKAIDVDLHVDFVIRVLESPGISGGNLIRFFKWAMGRKGFTVTTTVVEALVLQISGETRRMDAYSLWDLIREIGEKESSVLNLGIMNELIAALGKLNKPKAAFDVFSKIEEFGFSPDGKTYYLTLEALCKRSFTEWACSVCEKMIAVGILPESSREVGNIITLLCKEGKAIEAQSVYMLAKTKDKYPPRKSTVTLINSLCKNDETVPLAQQMLGDLTGEDRRQGIKPFSDVIRGLCRTKNVRDSKALLLDMISRGPPPGNAVFNSIINACSKAGELNEAREMIKLMESRGLKPDLYAYTVIISGYTKAGLMDEACEVLAEAKRKHKKLTPVTYHTLVRGYCKMEEYDKAMKLLSEMDRFGVKPNADEYGKLIQSLCLKALDWKTAEKLAEELKEKGLYLNAITRGLIHAVKELESEALKNADEKLLAEA
ncbi:PREDICTED: pentatricopeptide repeat-containing protein At3g02650, mitochondrial-like [Tarenaya hassleriana]|uniref:pentatricopeptide repeat-containing protein At3g02650, mitochondrial-like n=1 Tax=Tarenaya hassleriana TaxID=28532 RepID=UPI00053C4929|nr:PREDICTED: pentatricopeptide repeat-containing protein At3g02650, mitochondrial-like [Tarenaya hassleriana]XP_019059601.1 PREDICTED: pentatricopeptide repeat-containing protein At3g02650, mitochondrial-like [Tarenaya hassleriana]